MVHVCSSTLMTCDSRTHVSTRDGKWDEMHSDCRSQPVNAKCQKYSVFLITYEVNKSYCFDSVFFTIFIFSMAWTWIKSKCTTFKAQMSLPYRVVEIAMRTCHSIIGGMPCCLHVHREYEIFSTFHIGGLGWKIISFHFPFRVTIKCCPIEKSTNCYNSLATRRRQWNKQTPNSATIVCVCRRWKIIIIFCPSSRRCSCAET